ncbi:DNA-directed RNA polymerase II subunit RPB11, partial [Fragariocoptes setiger]
MNAPNSFDSFLLAEGESKITMEKDTKVPNAAVFTVYKEDHTLGNMIRMQLLKDPKVLFAGYKVIHPLEYKFALRIQTVHGYYPIDALLSAINDLMSEISLLDERFREAVEASVD